MSNPTKQLTQETLKHCLTYDPSTGEFTWVNPIARGVKPGEVAGNTNARGYRRVSVYGKSYLAHRLAFLYMTGDWPADKVDHINGCFSDNRWNNLRDATQQQNLRNTRCHGVSGIKNVYKDHNRWNVKFSVDKKSTSYGSYKTREEAEERALAVRESLHGDFCNNL